MNYSEEHKKYILQEHLRNISHISDLEYQIRVWIKGLGPECDDFDETVCHFFDDGNPILNKYKDYGITESQYNLLMKFREEFDAFTHKYYHPLEFLTSPDWKKIMDMAKEILKAFNYQKKD